MQVLEACAQQIGRLLQEKGAIKMRIKEIADYAAMKCNECGGMTSSMFFCFSVVLHSPGDGRSRAPSGRDCTQARAETGWCPACLRNNIWGPSVFMIFQLLSMYFTFSRVCLSFHPCRVCLLFCFESVCFPFLRHQYHRVLVTEKPKRFLLMKYWKPPKKFLYFHFAFIPLNYVMVRFMLCHDT